MKTKILKCAITIILSILIAVSLTGCIPKRDLLPTMAPTAEPDKNQAHKLELIVEPKEGGSAKLSTTEVKYDDVAELTVECADGYRLSSIKVGYDEIFLNDNIGYITNVIDDTAVTVRFSEEKASTAETVVPGSITTTFYDEDAKEFGITWHTKKPGHPIVKYIKAGGQTLENVDFTEAITVTGYTQFTAANYKNYVALTNLEYDTKYFYICGDAEHEVYSEVYSFTTRKENQQEVTFLHFSDTQDTENNGSIWAAGLKHGYTTYPETNFVIHTGDIVQEGGLEEQWNLMLGNAAPYLKDSVLVGTAGNHDYWADYLYYATECTYSHFNIKLPFQNSVYGMYYSFDYGDAHFTVLNTGDTMETGNAGLTDSQIIG